MTRNRICVQMLILVSCLYLLISCACQNQLSISITVRTSGVISLVRSYICGNYNSTHYYALNNLTGNYELISTDATQTISYALSKLTPGRTWQETVLLKGIFSISSTVTVNQAYVLLDCRQAILTSKADIILEVRSAEVTILGGYWIGQSAYVRIRFASSSATNCTIDSIDAKNFLVELAYGCSYITIQNSYFHDTTNSYFLTIVSVSHHNVIKNCHFHNGTGAAIFVSHQAPYNQFIECEFDNLHNHAIYLDGGEGSVGNNIVTGCKFHDHYYNAGIHVKCNNNTIYNNTFYNFFPGSVGLSIYSEYVPSYANDNEIYNNIFTNMSNAIWIGHNPAHYKTLRNKIHDNTFTNIASCIRLNPYEGAVNTTEDTKIYYNNFYNCTNPFPATGGSYSLIRNTVIAYNYFDGYVPTSNVDALKAYYNTMSYQNTFFPPSTTLAMENFNYSLVIDPESWYYVPPR